MAGPFTNGNRALIVQYVGLAVLTLCALIITALLRETRIQSIAEEAARREGLTQQHEIMVRIDSLRTEITWNNFINWYNSARIDTMEERKRLGR